MPDFPVHTAVLTSLFGRNNVHLVGVDIRTSSCHSIALDIKRKVTEFSFQEKGIKHFSDGESHQTLHNCVLDCHAEVWTRFPVVPAIRRRTITSLSDRRQKMLRFVTDYAGCHFAPYFSRLIQDFEMATKKPVGEELKSIRVLTDTYEDFLDNVLSSEVYTTVSIFRVGEWIADFLCLIPIHIAVCRDNRFIPLKDGVYSPELEKSLLGAEVTKIVDSLSFGWYESIFQSYMASKVTSIQ